MTDANRPTEEGRVMPDSRPAVLARPTDAAIANRDAADVVTPASYSDYSRRSGNTAQPETDDTSDMDSEERDDSPYCDCGSIPGEEEEAANRCACCGKRIEL